MRTMFKIWLAAAVAVSIFLLHESMCDQRAEELQSCSVVRCI
jgi:hypothetical protein